MSKPINIKLAEPFQDGYIVIPKSILKQCEDLTQSFALVPTIDGVGSKAKRRIKTMLIAIDMLNKIKNKTDVITAQKVSEILSIPEKDVEDILYEAVQNKVIDETETGDFVLNYETKKAPVKSAKKPGEHKQLITLYHDKFLIRFGDKPDFATQDFAVAASLVKKYSIEELTSIIDKYFELDNSFLKSAGYKLRYLPNSINSIVVANADDSAARRKKKIYKKSDYAGELTPQQIEDYKVGKQQGKWTGDEPWAKLYEKAIAEEGK